MAWLLTDTCDVSITMLPMDTEEDKNIHEFAPYGCTLTSAMTRHPCAACSQKATISAFSEMTHDELDLDGSDHSYLSPLSAV